MKVGRNTPAVRQREIVPLAREDRVTVFIFQLSHPDRIAEREPLI